MKIIIDAMGGDNAPQEIVKGAAMALSQDRELKVVLTGDEAKIKAALAGLAYDPARLEIVHCTEVITNDDAPTLAIRQKKDSSLVVALKMLKEDADAAGFVSAGSTGAVLTGALLRVGRIRGISRPAVCPALPTAKGGKVLIIDAGANAECKPVNLCHFALMGTAYAKAFGVKDPRVGLVTNGTEDHKGDPLHQEAHNLLKTLPGINFVGNVEGRDMGDFIVSVDPKGELAFSSHISEKKGREPAHIIEALTEQAAPKYLAYLREKGVSYVFAGKEALDCGLLLQKLHSLFAIEKLMVAGGGVMNWSFLSAGLLDEISLVVAPVADGSNTAVSIFEQAPFLPGHSPVGLTLKESKVLEGDALWLRYVPKK